MGVDEEAVTLIVLSHFLEREPTDRWQIIYVSDQYVTFSVDSTFVSRLPQIGAEYVVAKRADAEERPDIVRDGGLLLEPLATRVRSDGFVVQPLNFSANADYGGEYLYRLRAYFGRWTVVAVYSVWLI